MENKTITPWVCWYCQYSNPEHNTGCRHCHKPKRIDIPNSNNKR